MKVGVISDTHGNILSAERAIKAMGEIDLLIHAGDTYRDAILLEEKMGIDVIAVKGNTDFDCDADLQTTIMIEDKRIFLTHGHIYNVKYNLSRLYYKALESESNIAIFGHSHIPAHIKEEGIILLNPGSVSSPRDGRRPSYAVMDISKDNIKIELFELK